MEHTITIDEEIRKLERENNFYIKCIEQIVLELEELNANHNDINGDIEKIIWRTNAKLGVIKIERNNNFIKMANLRQIQNNRLSNNDTDKKFKKLAVIYNFDK